MSLAEKICLSAAFLFFMTGLLTGIWKYRHMARSEDATSPVYVDIAHRSSLLYSFAALLLAAFSAHSVLADWVNTTAAVAALMFFAFAIGTYVVHGLLQDTDNQLRRPHRLGKRQLPSWVTGFFMLLLIVGEVGGALVLGTGAMIGVWNG
ncbi:MAG: hypothetical protein COB82_10270 [Marinobacter sp.]|jgi:hypothetical protein|nr:hypothetical protein [Marinobacter sp.]PHQ72508.1 MAG: hypothetical protein COB82_10270 [Marinobacter sp.]